MRGYDRNSQLNKTGTSKRNARQNATEEETLRDHWEIAGVSLGGSQGNHWGIAGGKSSELLARNVYHWRSLGGSLRVLGGSQSTRPSPGPDLGPRLCFYQSMEFNLGCGVRLLLNVWLWPDTFKLIVHWVLLGVLPGQLRNNSEEHDDKYCVYT